MARFKVSPGPVAAHAFRLGMIAAGVVGLAAIGLSYWLGHLTLPLAGYSVLVLFPVYLVFIASMLSVWLGYDKDTTSLRPVYRKDGGR